MRPQKVNDAQIIDGLTKVFRSKGYDGSNLSELAEVTNLKKASLYHRFPGGKEEMASAVLSNIQEWVHVNITELLEDEEIDPIQKLQTVITSIKESYDDGKSSCLYRALSLESGMNLFHQQIKDGMQSWIKAFESYGISIGLLDVTANKFAIQTLIDIQGSLVVAKGLGNISIFENTMTQIESRYKSK